MDPLGMNKTGHDDLSTPRRRLTMDLNRPERISLFQGKQVQENKIMPTRKGMNYDPIDFIDSSFDIPRSKRRRTIQRDEILNSQTENDILSQQNHNLKRPALDNDHLETRQPLDRNVEPSTSIAPESKDKDIVLLKERISLVRHNTDTSR